MPRKAALTQPKAPRRAKATPPAPPPTPPAYTDTWLAVAALHLDARIQPRLGIDPQVVDTYADLYREAEEGEEPLPPLDVFTIQGTYAVADGFHRLRAAHNAGLAQVRCHVYPGTLRDAMVHAALANTARGLPYTDGDKARVITRLLADPEFAAQSDRALARRLGLSNTYVSRLRRRLEARARLEAQVGLVHPAGEGTPPTPAHLAALLQVPQEAIKRASMVDYEATPASLLDRVVRLIADDGLEEARAIDQVARRFRLYDPEPEAPWPKPTAAEKRAQRELDQRQGRANVLLVPLADFTHGLDFTGGLEELVWPVERMRVLWEDDAYERPADVPTLEDVLAAVGETGRLDELADFLTRSRAVIDAIEAAMVAYHQQPGVG